MECDEQPYQHRSEVSNEPNDNTSQLKIPLILSSSLNLALKASGLTTPSSDHWGALRQRFRAFLQLAQRWICFGFPPSALRHHTGCRKPLFITGWPPFLWGWARETRRTRRFWMRERQTIPTKGPDSHVPSTPSVKDVTSCGGYHRITTVRLKSQADETQPGTPIGRTPEEREIADTVCLFIRPQEYQSEPVKRSKSPSHKRFIPRGIACLWF